MIEFGTVRGAHPKEVTTGSGCTALVWLCSDLGVCLVLTNENAQVPCDRGPCMIGVYPISKPGEWDHTDGRWEGGWFGESFEDLENCQRWLDAFEKRPMLVVLGSAHGEQEKVRRKAKLFKQAVLELCNLLSADGYVPGNPSTLLKVLRIAE